MLGLKILPHIFLAYAIIFALCGIHIVATVLIAMLVGMLVVCRLPKSEQIDADEVLLPNKVSIIAHRGAGSDAPENTLAAIRNAKKNGADAIEFDVDYTMDNVAVVIHDSTVDRTTNGNGCISTMPHQKVLELNASANHWLKDKFPNEKIPTLEETVQLCMELDLKMYIDVKGSAKKSAEVLSALFSKYPDLYRKAIVCSFYPQIVYLVKRADPKIVTGLTHRHRVLTRRVDGTERDGAFWKKLAYPVVDVVLEWSHFSWLWMLCGNSAFLINDGDVNRQVVEHFRQRGVQVIVWTVNNTTEKKHVASNLKCSYMTDTLQ